MKKFKNIFMALENACILTCLMSGFPTFTFTKLEVLYFDILIIMLCRSYFSRLCKFEIYKLVVAAEFLIDDRIAVL